MQNLSSPDSEPKRFSKLELGIMNAIWTRGSLPIREIQESFPAANRPAYTTVQTTVYRLEEKGALRRVKKIGNAHIFEAIVSRDRARGSLLEDLLSLFGGRPQTVMAHLVETGKLSLDDIREAEKLLEARKEEPKQ
jgi:BlaI family transcriptional regulator, penicillinase repressor